MVHPALLNGLCYPGYKYSSRNSNYVGKNTLIKLLVKKARVGIVSAFIFNKQMNPLINSNHGAYSNGKIHWHE